MTMLTVPDPQDRPCACQAEPGQFGPWHPYRDTVMCPQGGPVTFEDLAARDDEESSRWASLDNGSGEVGWAMEWVAQR